MKIIVTHASPDWDAITSVWLIKKYLPGWQDAAVQFVPAGERCKGANVQSIDAIERIGGDEVIHVDTGLGPLDHHQTASDQVCGASLTWDFVRGELEKQGEKLTDEHREAVTRIVRVVVAIDHFKEVFWPDAVADYQEFSLFGILEGLKYEKPDADAYFVDFGMLCLNFVLADFENRIWAEKEIKEKGIQFETRYGKGLGFETLNDTVLKLSQKMGYILVVRKDPRKGYVRIKALPEEKQETRSKKQGVDLTLIYEQLKKIDPDATWFLHVSKKMLLNGSPKNPKMRATKLSLSEIIKVLERI